MQSLQKGILTREEAREAVQIFLSGVNILVKQIISVLGNSALQTIYGSISAGRGKWSKCGIFLIFGALHCLIFSTFLNCSEGIFLLHSKMFSFWSYLIKNPSQNVNGTRDPPLHGKCYQKFPYFFFNTSLTCFPYCEYLRF